jgi:hypothetical protein
MDILELLDIQGEGGRKGSCHEWMDIVGSLHTLRMEGAKEACPPCGWTALSRSWC